jgi:hypothetical protein
MSQWKWRYSRWTGVMYGPVPVGVIVAVIVFAILLRDALTAPNVAAGPAPAAPTWSART